MATPSDSATQAGDHPRCDHGGGGNVSSQVQFVCDFRRDVLEPDRRSRDTLESDAVERQPRQLAHLHLPLDNGVAGAGRVTRVRAQQQKALALFVVAAVVVKHAPNLAHHIVRVHRARRLHAPREAQRPRLR